MTEVNTTSSSPLVGAMGKIKESAMHIFGQVRYDPPPRTIEARTAASYPLAKSFPIFFIPPVAG